MFCPGFQISPRELLAYPMPLEILVMSCSFIHLVIHSRCVIIASSPGYRVQYTKVLFLIFLLRKLSHVVCRMGYLYAVGRYIAVIGLIRS